MSCDSITADLTEFPVVAGDPYVLEFGFLDSNEEPLDLTGYTADLVAQMDPDAEDYEVELDELDGIEIDAEAGTVTPTIPTTGLIGKVHFRLTITPAGGNPESIQGTFTVRARL